MVGPVGGRRGDDEPSPGPDAARSPRSERTDADLMRAHTGGDPDAFAELVRRHQGRMWSVAVSTLRNPDDAADAVQDALISAYRAAAGWRGDAAVSTWLHRIVVNACLDRLRRAKVRPASELPETGPGEPADPRDRMAESDAQLVVGEALAQLGEDQRAAITLVDLYGYSVTDAADILGVADGTVKSRCARGRSRLVQLLGHHGGNPAAPRGVPTGSGGATPTAGWTEGADAP